MEIPDEIHHFVVLGGGFKVRQACENNCEQISVP